MEKKIDHSQQVSISIAGNLEGKYAGKTHVRGASIRRNGYAYEST